MTKPLKLTLSVLLVSSMGAAAAGNPLQTGKQNPGTPAALAGQILKNLGLETRTLTQEEIQARDAAIAAGKSPEEAIEAVGDKVKELHKVPGQPYRIVFQNGKVIGFKLKVNFTPLRTSIVLSDNSCSRTIGTKGEFVIPLVLRNLIPYWVAHPRKQGEPVLEYDTDDKKEKVKASAAFLTRLLDPDFDANMSSVPANGIDDANALKLAKATKDAFGWFECPGQAKGKGNCDGLMPKNTEALFWDENFETQNSQARMSRSMEQPSFTQMTSRLQQLQLKVRGNRVTFGAPAKTFGAFAQFLPPGITYQVQWTFRDKNLVEPDDELCQMKWDLDFTRVFTQFTKITESLEDPATVNYHAYPEYNYNAKDEENLFFAQLFQAPGNDFEGSDVRK